MKSPNPPLAQSVVLAFANTSIPYNSNMYRHSFVEQTVACVCEAWGRTRWQWMINEHERWTLNHDAYDWWSPADQWEPTPVLCAKCGLNSTSSVNYRNQLTYKIHLANTMYLIIEQKVTREAGKRGFVERTNHEARPLVDRRNMNLAASRTKHGLNSTSSVKYKNWQMYGVCSTGAVCLIIECKAAREARETRIHWTKDDSQNGILDSTGIGKL